ncbi:MAG: flavodoxin domain-containing protein [Psychrobium sp.]|nr:flavodoxin domain-containing protein [Psychrobium sp.]
MGIFQKSNNTQFASGLFYTLSRLLIITGLLGAALWLFFVGLLLELPASNAKVIIHSIAEHPHMALIGIFSSADYRLTQALMVLSSLESQLLVGLLNVWRYSIFSLVLMTISALLLSRQRLLLLTLLLCLASGALDLQSPVVISVQSLCWLGLHVIFFVGYGYAVHGLFSRSLLGRAKMSLIAYASQSGTAKGLAKKIAQSSAGYCDIKAFGELTPNCLQQYQQLFVVAATYGDGQAPEKSQGFIQALAQCDQGLHNLNFAVLALGDSAYPKFCAFGHQIATMLSNKGAQALHPVQEIDRGHFPSASQWWGRVCDGLGWHVETLNSHWAMASVTENRCLNPLQPHRMAHSLKLRVIGASYQAGDLLEVLTPIKRQDIAQKLKTLGFKSSTKVQFAGQTTPLIDALAHLEWHEQTANEPQALVDLLPVLAPRVYSIASKPNDPEIELLVRRLVKDDGSHGFSSSRLCTGQTGDNFKVSIRSHDSFRLPSDNVPIILICAGTGIAPYMSFLAQRQQMAFDAPIWLIFGEQYQDSGCYFKERLGTYVRDGRLTDLSYAFSRDKAWLDALNPRYVNDVLFAQRDKLKNLVIQHNGHIFVCGSKLGLGQSVKIALGDIFSEHYQFLVENSRLHFDLY